MSLKQNSCHLMFIAVPKCIGNEIRPSDFIKSREVTEKIIAAEKSIKKHNNVLYGGLFCGKNKYATKASQVLEKYIDYSIIPCDALKDKIETSIQIFKPRNIDPQGLIIIISDEETISEMTKDLFVIKKPYGLFLPAMSVASNN